MRNYKLILDSGRELTLLPPTVRQYYKERAEISGDEDMFRFMAGVCSRNLEGVPFTAEGVLDSFTTDDFRRFWEDFMDWVRNEKSADPN